MPRPTVTSLGDAFSAASERPTLPRRPRLSRGNDALGAFGRNVAIIDPLIGARGRLEVRFTPGAAGRRGDTEDTGEWPSSVVVSLDVDPLLGGNGVPASGDLV